VSWKTITATWFCWLCCLLSGSCFAQAPENKPDYYGATDPAGSAGLFAASQTSMSEACERAGARRYSDLQTAGGSSLTYTYTSCQARVAGAGGPTSTTTVTQPPTGGAGSYSYTYTTYHFQLLGTMRNNVTNSVTNITGEVTQIVAYCRPSIPWVSTVYCGCTEGAATVVASGYWDSGYYADQLVRAPASWCRPIASGSSLGCVSPVTRYGPWRGSLAGVRHTFDGAVYKGTIQTCSSPGDKPTLSASMPADACPTGYAYKIEQGAEVCRRTIAESSPNPGASTCVVGDPCYFEPGSPPANPAVTPPGTTPGTGTGTGTGTGSITDAVCALSLIKPICDWFKQDTSDTNYQAGASLEANKALNTIAAEMTTPSVGQGSLAVACVDNKVIHFTHWIGDVTIPMQWWCSLGANLRPLIMAAGAFVGIFIVLG